MSMRFFRPQNTGFVAYLRHAEEGVDAHTPHCECGVIERMCLRHMI